MTIQYRKILISLILRAIYLIIVLGFAASGAFLAGLILSNGISFEPVTIVIFSIYSLIFIPTIIIGFLPFKVISSYSTIIIIWICLLVIGINSFFNHA